MVVGDIIHWFYPYRSYGSNNGNDTRYHKAVPLSKLIPKELCEKYNATLIHGYVHVIERELNLSHDIPQEIVQLILFYFV